MHILVSQRVSVDIYTNIYYECMSKLKQNYKNDKYIFCEINDWKIDCETSNIKQAKVSVMEIFE